VAFVYRKLFIGQKQGWLDGYPSDDSLAQSVRNLRDEFLQTIVSNHLFEVDRDRYTCSGRHGGYGHDVFLILVSNMHVLEQVIII